MPPLNVVVVGEGVGQGQCGGSLGRPTIRPSEMWGGGCWRRVLGSGRGIWDMGLQATSAMYLGSGSGIWYVCLGQNSGQISGDSTLSADIVATASITTSAMLALLSIGSCMIVGGLLLGRK